MRATLILAKAFAKRQMIEMSRYAFDTVTGLVLTFALFVVLFFGVKGIGGISEGKTLSSMVLGFNIWALLAFSYSAIATGLTAEAQTGTLEQMAMAPRGLLGTVLVQFSVSFVFILLQISILLVLAMAVTGRWLHVDLLGMLPLLLMTAAGILGLGLGMGGLALVFKKVEAVSSMFQTGLIVVIALPVDRFPIAKLVPFSLGYQLLSDVMVEGRSITSLPLGDLGLLLGGVTAYLLLGIVVFKKMEGAARDRALLGQY